MLLDSDILIDIVRGYAPALAWLNALPELPNASGIAAMELCAGCKNATQMRETQEFLSLFALLCPSAEALKSALDIFVLLRLSHGLGVLDCQIAATAIERNIPLATFNIKHFRAVPGLITLQPYIR